MFLERLELTDFRNYERGQLALDAPLCLFLGANAQGKTNILEAVYLLAMARSPRTSRDAEMVRWGAGEAVVRAEVRRSARAPVAVSLQLRDDGGKQIKVDGMPRRRLMDAVGEINAVLFHPDDLALVAGGPEGRRGYLNGCIGQIDPPYLEALAGYRRVLRQRNSLLRGARERAVDENLLLAYDDQLAVHAATIMLTRRRSIEALAREAAAVHQRLSGGGETLEMVYQPNLSFPDGGPRDDGPGDERAALERHLAELAIARRSAELRRGSTLAGPHRDDLGLTLDGVDARAFASQGQQRTIALALRIAELRVVTAAIGEPPLLLLDDVMSELDERRRAEVMALTDEAEQILITDTHAETFRPDLLARAAVFRVDGGRVELQAAPGTGEA